MNDGVTVMLLSASLQHKKSAARDCLCQSMWNWKYHLLSMPNHVRPKTVM